MSETYLMLIRWRDAHFSLLDDYSDEEDFILETVGWARDDGRWVRVEGEHYPEGSDPVARQVTRIPQENVIERVRLYTEEDFRVWSGP